MGFNLAFKGLMCQNETHMYKNASKISLLVSGKFSLKCRVL